MSPSYLTKTFFIPNGTTLALFIPFALLAAGFFYSPMGFVSFLLPIGGLWYYVLATLMVALEPFLGSSYSGFGEEFMTILAITGVAYLYTLSCYISFVIRRKKNDAKRAAMSISLAAIFISPFAIAYGQAYLTPVPEIQATSVSYLDENTCTGFQIIDGSSSWNNTSQECTIEGTLETYGASILAIKKGVTLKISGFGSKLENNVPNVLRNNGTIILAHGAVLINHRNLTDSGDKINAVILNQGMTEIQVDSSLINEGWIDGMNTGRILNKGTFDNRGETLDTNIIENYGTLNNHGTISNQYGDSTIWNYGSIFNLFVFDNSGGTIENYGSIDNGADMYSAFIHNHSELDSTIGDLYSDGISVYCGAKTTVTNKEIIIENACNK